MLNYQHIKEYAAEAGFSLCGVARARVLTERLAPYEAALVVSGVGADEGSGGLDYLARGYERRLDPETLLKGARTVVVCALAYPRGDYSSVPRTAAFAQLPEDYHTLVKGKLRDILARLQGDVASVGPRAKICCDTSPLLEKAWAVEAGIGWQGRNSLIINPQFGSFLLLGEIILDDECDRYDEPFDVSAAGLGCGDCRACIAACPVKAISKGLADGAPAGIVDTSRCISALTVESARRGIHTVPIHGWGYGCDECQLVCPANRCDRSTPPVCII